MWLSIVRTIISVATLTFWSVSLQAQTQVTSRNVKPGGSVSGRVTIKGKGAPGIAVTLRKPEANNPFETMRAITDQDGNFKITNVAPGSWDIEPSPLAYVVISSEQAARRSLVVGEGENLENINFALVKGGVITGKITDADGRVVIQTQVRLHKMPPNASGPNQQNPVAYPSSSSLTDDRGIYRFFGLTVGKYLVSVGSSNMYLNMTGRAAYKEVFYPDTSDNAKATVIEVTEGSVSDSIDIALGRAMETFTISGRVVEGEKGAGVPGFRFYLMRFVADQPELINSAIVSNASGDFTVENLLPGKYQAFLIPEANAELRVENTSFEIIDSDVTGVTVRLAKGASVSGVVVLETEDKKAAADLGKLQVIGFVQNPNGGTSFGNSSRSAISPDGSFRLGGLSAGMAYIQLAPALGGNQLKGFAVSRIERDGAVLPPRGFEIKDSEQVTGVRIIVAYGNATLRGVVTIENGTLPPGSRIMIRLMKPGDVPVNMRPPNVDDRGHFVAEGIPPGSYEIWIIISGLRAPVKQSVVLQDGVATDVNITVDMGTPKP
jgi:hypothetical protein